MTPRSTPRSTPRRPRPPQPAFTRRPSWTAYQAARRFWRQHPTNLFAIHRRLRALDAVLQDWR